MLAVEHRRRPPCPRPWHHRGDHLPVGGGDSCARNRGPRDGRAVRVPAARHGGGTCSGPSCRRSRPPSGPPPGSPPPGPPPSYPPPRSIPPPPSVPPPTANPVPPPPTYVPPVETAPGTPPSWPTSEQPPEPAQASTPAPPTDQLRARAGGPGRGVVHAGPAPDGDGTSGPGRDPGTAGSSRDETSRRRSRRAGLIAAAAAAAVVAAGVGTYLVVADGDDEPARPTAKDTATTDSPSNPRPAEAPRHLRP